MGNAIGNAANRWRNILECKVKYDYWRNGFEGHFKSAIEIGKKQISLILNLIENDEYANILLKLGKNKLIEFEKSELTSLLSDDKNRIVDDFLMQMTSLNILENVGRKANEKYTFTNRLYFVYFLIKAKFS